MLRRYFTILCLILVGVLSGCQSSSMKEGTWIVGTSANYPPYEFIDEKGNFAGFDIDLAQEISKRMGKKLEIRQFSFDALILNLKKHRIHSIMAGMSITKERLKEVLMVPYHGEYVRNLYVVSLQPLEEVLPLTQYSSIAVETGTFYEDYLLSLPGVRVRSLDSMLEVLMDVRCRKSPVAVLAPTVARTVLKDFPELHVAYIDLPEDRWDLGCGIAVAKDQEALATQLEQIIREIKEENVMADLEKKWFSSEEAKS